MKAIEVYADLRRFGKPVFSTEDVAQRLRAKTPAVSRMLHRLVQAGLLTAIRRGLFCIDQTIDPLALPEALTAPFPAYVSLQSALHLHGMIEQIPRVIYVVSLARTQRIRTTIGTYSIHHVSPEFFGGYNTVKEGIRLATPEKALVDVLYLSPARSRLFAALPELELPPTFRRKDAEGWTVKLPAARRTMVERKLDKILASANRGHHRR